MLFFFYYFNTFYNIYYLFFIFFLGKYFLVNCGFPNRPNFFAPFRGVHNHLQDFHGQDCHLENANELFNLRHVSLRNKFESLFGILNS